MKKGKKLGAIALCGIVSASALSGMPIVANNVSADEIRINEFQTTYSIDNNGEVKIPQGNTGTTMKVFPMGSSTEITDLDLTDNFFSFKPTAPQYKVTYTNGTTEKTFVINIDFKDAKIELNESAYLLPEKTVKGRDVILPFAVLKDSEGNKLDVNYLNADEYSVSVKNKSTATIDVVESTIDYSESIKYLKFNPENPGTYTVTYKISKLGYETVTSSYTVNVGTKHETTADISFKLNSAIGTPTIGKEFTLPTVKAKDNTNDIDGIKVKVDLTYQVMNDKGEKTEPVKIENFKFTPKQEGYYIFTYVVSDAFGNKAPVYSSKVATKVNDTVAPSDIIYTKDYVVVDGVAYETDAVGQKTDKLAKNASYLIKTNINVGDAINIPAIFAKDNVADNLTYSRTLKRYEGGLVKEEINIDQDCTKLITQVINTEGNYTLTYTVKDEKGNQASRDFSFYCYSASAWTDTTNPTITFSAEIDESIKWGNEISINKPAVSDVDDQARISDTNCETIAKYFYKATKTSEPDKQTDKFELELQSNNKFKIQTYQSISELEELLDVADLSTWDIALCFEYTAIDDNGNSETQVKEIKVIGATEVPTLIYTAPALIPIAQGDEVTLGEIKVSYPSGEKFKEYLKDVDVNVEIINDQTKAKVLAYGGSYAFVGNDLKVTGTKFLASYSGDYTIIISIVDINGNTVIQETSITGVTQVYPTQIVLDKETLEIELGKDDESAKIYTMYRDGNVVEATDLNLEITIVSGNSVAVDSNKYFKANSVGTSVVRFTMKSEDGLTTEDYKDLTVTVKDTKAPELIFELDNPYNSTYKKDQEITIVMPQVKDEGNLSTDDVIVTVKRNGTDITVTNNKFTPDADGTYTVEYKVLDASGNSANKSFSINVGDVDGPKVAIYNVPATKEVGSVYALDLGNDLEIWDEFDEAFTPEFGVNTFISMKDSEGKDIKSTTEGQYSYKLEKAGTYTLTIEARDNSGHTTTIDKTITVSEKEAEPASPNTAGTVIAILASLLILAFVIFYFFKPEKGTFGKNKKIEKVEKTEESKKDKK